MPQSPFAVHGEAAPAVLPEQASLFAWAIRDTLDQYLTIANQHGFTKRRQLLDLLDNYPGQDALIAWIREYGSDKWGEYLDTLTASPDAADQAAGGDETRNRIQPTPRDSRLPATSRRRHWPGQPICIRIPSRCWRCPRQLTRLPGPSWGRAATGDDR
jgi:hypothetical protein